MCIRDSRYSARDHLQTVPDPKWCADHQLGARLSARDCQLSLLLACTLALHITRLSLTPYPLLLRTAACLRFALASNLALGITVTRGLRLAVCPGLSVALKQCRSLILQRLPLGQAEVVLLSRT